MYDAGIFNYLFWTVIYSPIIVATRLREPP